MMQYIIKTQREKYKQPQHLRKKVQLYNSNKHMVYIIMVSFTKNHDIVDMYTFFSAKKKYIYIQKVGSKMGFSQ